MNVSEGTCAGEGAISTYAGAPLARTGRPLRSLKLPCCIGAIARGAALASGASARAAGANVALEKA